VFDWHMAAAGTFSVDNQQVAQREACRFRSLSPPTCSPRWPLAAVIALGSASDRSEPTYAGLGRVMVGAVGIEPTTSHAVKEVLS
jgi:hypothetical protein